MKNNIFISLIVAPVLFVAGCHSKAAKQPTLNNIQPGKTVTDGSTKEVPAYSYDLAQPVGKWQMPADLLEISGNAWIDKEHLLVIEDLHPVLYLLKLQDSIAVIEKKIPFAKEIAGQKFDVEDITVAGNTAYALWSHGSIYKISDWNTNPQVKVIPTFLNKKNNTEGICYDPVLNSLLIACKENNTVEDEKKSTRGIYQFNLIADSLMNEPFMLIHKKDLKKDAGEKINFYPSAIAVHPLTGDIYVLSTKENKCMAVFSADGKLKSLQFIQKEELAQPEGICFSPEGTLYISTEGKNGRPAYIFAFSKL